MTNQGQSYYPCDRVEVHLLSHIQRYTFKTRLCHMLALEWWENHASNLCLSFLICKMSRFSCVPPEKPPRSNVIWIHVIAWRPMISGVWWQSGWFTRLCWWAVRAMVLNSNVDEAVREWLSLFPSGLELISIYLSFHKPIINVKSLPEGSSSWRIGSTKNTEVCKVRMPWSSLWCPCSPVCVCPPHTAQLLSGVQLFSAPWTVAPQAILSLEFSRQECWHGLPISSPGDLPDSGITPTSLHWQADSFPLSTWAAPMQCRGYSIDCLGDFSKCLISPSHMFLARKLG